MDCRVTFQQFLKGISTPCSWICGTGSGPTTSLFCLTQNELLMQNLDHFQHTGCSGLSASCWQLTLTFFSLKWCRSLLPYIYREKMNLEDLIWKQPKPSKISLKILSVYLCTHSVALTVLKWGGGSHGELPSSFMVHKGNSPERRKLGC
jgi:hypothetical protein